MVISARAARAMISVKPELWDAVWRRDCDGSWAIPIVMEYSTTRGIHEDFPLKNAVRDFLRGQRRVERREIVVQLVRGLEQAVGDEGRRSGAILCGQKLGRRFIHRDESDAQARRQLMTRQRIARIARVIMENRWPAPGRNRRRPVPAGQST